MNRRILMGAAAALALLLGCKTTPESPVVTECNMQTGRCMNGQIQRCSVEGKWETFACEAGTACVEDGHGKAECRPNTPT
jgi:hypothetical protein